MFIALLRSNARGIPPVAILMVSEDGYRAVSALKNQLDRDRSVPKGFVFSGGSVYEIKPGMEYDCFQFKDDHPDCPLVCHAQIVENQYRFKFPEKYSWLRKVVES